jgi:hypothetical protein
MEGAIGSRLTPGRPDMGPRAHDLGGMTSAWRRHLVVHGRRAQHSDRAIAGA